MDTTPPCISAALTSRVRATVQALDSEFGSHPFHVNEAMSIGVAHDRVVRACGAGAFHRLGGGWYARAAVAGDQLARAEARLWVLHRNNPGVVACGRSAAAIWGLPLPPVPEPTARASVDMGGAGLEVAFVSGSGGLRGQRGDVLARRWSVPEDHVTRGPRGEPVTDPLRTAIDVTRGCSLALALGPLDAALRLMLSRGTPVEEGIRSLRTRCADLAGGHGISIVARAIAHADARAESPLESLVRGRIIEAGLPVPCLQVPLVGASGRRYRADMAMDLPGEPEGSYRLLIEADGLSKYATVEDLAEEKRRQHDLERQGHVFVRVLFREALWSPATFTDEISRLLDTSHD